MSDAKEYLSAVKTHLDGLEEVKTTLHTSANSAHRYKRLARRISIVLGALIVIVGIALSRASVSPELIPRTGIPIREALSYFIAVLGAAVTFINERFDPTRFREREIALGDLIHNIGILQEDARLRLLAINDQDVDAASGYLNELRNEEDKILKKAEKWMSGVRRIFESSAAASQRRTRPRIA